MAKKLFIDKYLLAATVLIVLAVSGVGVSFAHEGEDHSDGAAQTALSAEDKRVVSVLEGYAAAVQAADLAQIESYVITGDGFSSLEGTYLDLGWDSYRKHLADELPLFNDTSYRLSNIRPYVSGDLAFATMDYIMNVTIKSDQFEGGEHKLAMKGKATMVLSKSDNEWKIRHIHTSREQAKKPGPETSSH